MLNQVLLLNRRALGTWMNLVMLLMSYSMFYAQQLLPPVTNYTPDVYQAASQNWDISGDDRNIVYVANNEGLLSYDGARWNLNTLPNETIIRSVFCYENRVYTGSYEEFGYWQEDDYGRLQYTSLTHLLEEGSYTNEEFWQIEAYKGGIVFRSFGKVYIYDKDKITAIEPEYLVTAIKRIGKELYVGSINGRLYKLTNGVLAQWGTESLPGEKPVVDIAEVGGDIVVGTSKDGLYTISQDRIAPFPNDSINQFLRVNELNKIQLLNQKQVVFGTIRGGILLYNLETKSTSTYYRGKGLENNTVLAFYPRDNELWVGLDNGIDKIKLNAGITYYTENTGELGAVYDLTFHENILYLGSNTGIHYIEDEKRKFIPGSQGQVWSFSCIDSTLVANHNKGVYTVNRDILSTITNKTGSYSAVPLPGSQNTFLNATYNGLRLLRDTDDSITYQSTRGVSSTAPINKIVFEDSTTFWASHPYKGFYKLKTQDQGAEIVSLSEYTSYKPFQAFETSIHRIKSEIAFYNAGSWYRYNSIEDTIIPFEALSKYKNYDLVGNFESGYWFKNQDGPGLIYTDFDGESISILDPVLESRLIKGYENIDKVNDSIYLIALNDGYAKVNLGAYRNAKFMNELPGPQLRFLNIGRSSHTLTEAPLKIPYNEAGNLQLQLATPPFEEVTYYYKLGNIKNNVTQGFIEFQNLPSGSYDLKIWALKNGLKSKHPLIFSFTILAPWYLSVFAKLIYLLVFILIIFSIYRINKHKLNAHRDEVEIRLKKEQERIQQLQDRERLQQEINQKRKELANSTFQAAQRNKMLNEVKKELEQVQGQADNPSKYKAIEQKLNVMVEGRDDWKTFETNFKEVNQDFFQNLLLKYPDLSTKDLKLCAYLKMNLSTKEIAPLMAISVRGVEIHRYRLRKKLDLDTSKNLSKYLIKNF